MPSEKSIVDGIMKEIRKRGGWCFKHHGGPYATAGVPDVIACYRGVFVAIEAKQPGKDPTNLQQYTMGLINHAGGRSAVCHSALDAKFFLDQIDELLSQAS